MHELRPLAVHAMRSLEIVVVGGAVHSHNYERKYAWVPVCHCVSARMSMLGVYVCVCVVAMRVHVCMQAFGCVYLCLGHCVCGCGCAHTCVPVNEFVVVQRSPRNELRFPIASPQHFV